MHLKVPAEPDKLTAEKTQAQFKGCNLTNARQFYSKYGRDVSPDAVLFKRKAFEVLSSAVNALDRLDVRFWLSSGTCLGERHLICLTLFSPAAFFIAKSSQVSWVLRCS